MTVTTATFCDLAFYESINLDNLKEILRQYVCVDNV